MEGDKAANGAAASSGVLLLNCFVSPFGNRVRIALKLKGVAYEEQSEDLANKSPLLLSSNPVHAQVPVLIVRGKPVSESLVILEFIDDAFSAAGKPLLPVDPYARAHARFWASYVNTLNAAGRRVWQSPKGAAAAAVEAAKKDTVAALKTLEAELGEKAYFGGDTLGYVDVALVPFAPWFLTYERFGGFSVAAEVPALAAWADRCAADNACVAESLPEAEHVFQFACGMRKAFGLD